MCAGSNLSSSGASWEIFRDHNYLFFGGGGGDGGVVVMGGVGGEGCLWRLSFRSVGVFSHSNRHYDYFLFFPFFFVFDLGVDVCFVPRECDVTSKQRNKLTAAPPE